MCAAIAIGARRCGWAPIAGVKPAVDPDLMASECPSEVYVRTIMVFDGVSPRRVLAEASAMPFGIHAASSGIVGAICCWVRALDHLRKQVSFLPPRHGDREKQGF